MLLNSFRREILDDYPPRSEGKIRSYGSCTDVSAWSNVPSRRSKVLLSWIKRKARTKPYIPLHKLLDITVKINDYPSKKKSKCPRSCHSEAVVEEINQTLTKLQNTFRSNDVIIKYFERAQIDYESNNLKRIIKQKIDVLCQIITENVSDSLEKDSWIQMGGTALSERGTQSDDSFRREFDGIVEKSSRKMDSGVQFSWQIIQKDNDTQYESPNLNMLPKCRTNVIKDRSARIDTKNSEVSCNMTENMERDLITLQKLYQSQLINFSRLKEENVRLKRNIKEERNCSSHSDSHRKVAKNTKNNINTRKMLSGKTKSGTEIIMKVFQNEISENITHIEINHKTSSPLLGNTSVNKNDAVQDPLEVLFQVTNVFQTIMKKEYSKIHNAKCNNADDTQIDAHMS